MVSEASTGCISLLNGEEENPHPALANLPVIVKSFEGLGKERDEGTRAGESWVGMGKLCGGGSGGSVKLLGRQRQF